MEMSSQSAETTVGTRKRLRARIAFSLIVLFSVVLMLAAVNVSSVFAQSTESGAAATLSPEKADVMKWGLIAAAIAFGFGALGAGIAIANVGAAAMGAISEKPEIASQALIFIALAEGLVVFGFITAIMILGRL
jgi:V/A-type H+/Na+-transporting ATPase subunit K